MRMSEIHDAMLRASQHVDLLGEPTKEPEPVLTLRDQFAMAVLPALLQKESIKTAGQAAENAYYIADVMMLERAK